MRPPLSCVSHMGAQVHTMQDAYDASILIQVIVLMMREPRTLARADRYSLVAELGHRQPVSSYRLLIMFAILIDASLVDDAKSA